MKLTVIIETQKVVAHRGDGMPVIETIKQAISPQATFNKFVKYLPNQNYKAANVLTVLEDDKEVDKIAEYQTIIDSAIKPQIKAGEAVDYKALSEKQASLLADMEQRLKALEEQKEVKTRGRKPKIDNN